MSDESGVDLAYQAQENQPKRKEVPETQTQHFERFIKLILNSFLGNTHLTGDLFHGQILLAIEFEDHLAFCR